MNNNQFRNGFAIFQGGGCKAIAYLGAYEEAVDEGIYFSEFAGTSAGAIFAALLAAGATVGQLKGIVEQSKLEEFEFSRIKKDTLKANCLIRSFFWLINSFLSCTRLSLIRTLRVFSFLTKSIQYSGVYSSKGVEDWLDKNLQKVLNKTDDVFFKDLKFPLTILAADIQNQCVKIWSKSNTPEIKVSYAVRCSCTIPIFYQPVDNQYVDGGILSNLPTYLLDQRSVFTEVYAFGFESKKAVSKIEKIEMYYENIINTIVSGNIEIQLSISDDQKNYIKINTGDIEATDFKKIFPSSIIDTKRVNWLIEQGRRAMKEFLKNKSASISHTQNVLRNKTELFNWVVNEALNITYDKVFLCLEELTLTQSLFPLFLEWREKRKDVFLGVNGQSLFEEIQTIPSKYFLLQEISILKKVQSKICFITFVKADKIKSAIVWDINKIEKASFYQENKDNSILVSLFNLIKNFFPQTIVQGHGNLILKATQLDIITNALKKVKVYKNEPIKVSFKKIEIDKLLFLTNYVKGYKYRMVDIIGNYLIQKQLKSNCIWHIEIQNKYKSIITPPVIEERQGKYYLIEGNCRCYYQKQKGDSEIYSIVVEGIKASLPSNKTYSINDLIVIDLEATGKDRYKGFDYSLFRDIENAIHS